MTRIEKSVSLMVGIIIAVSTAITLIISVALCSAHNDSTFRTMADIGVNVLRADVERKYDDLKVTYDQWAVQSQMSTAMKSGFVGTLSEIYDKAHLDENTFCLFTDAEGTKLWASDNFKLASYDVSKPLSYDAKVSKKEEDYFVSGIYKDENVALSYIFAAPVVYGDSLLVGTCLIGYDLTSTDYLEEIKAETGNDVTMFADNVRASTTLLNADGTRNIGTTMNDDVKAVVIDSFEIYNGHTQILGHDYFVCYEPFKDIYGNVAGAYFAGQPTTESDKAFETVIIVVIIAALVIITVAAIVVVIAIKRMVAKPIVEVSKLAENMSRGKLNIPDFTYRFDKNEVGDFAMALQDTKHSLSAYINDISNVLLSMSNGDFTTLPSMRYEGDFSLIEESFREIRERLSGIVQNINTSSEQVMSGSVQMADGSQILANGTTTQANAIEELNATITAISDKIAINADNAMRAKTLSDGVEKSAVEQNSDMNSVMEAMADIESKSSQISSIIKTIDDIAFQTNILALNAAVEAARAGAAGKGFAVVADEVRNLASKSAEAAQHTTTLISATVSAVNSGTALVNAAAESMKEITEKTKETSNLIDEISSASAEQAEAIRQVTKGLEQISDVVQQNSATAEETAASCEELSGQSQMLRKQIGMLKA